MPSKIILDYVFPISVIEPLPAASTAFLKQVIVVAKPKSGQEGNVGNLYPCTSMSAVLALTDNAESAQLFAAGMSKVFILLAADLNLAAFLELHGPEAYTVLISSDFDMDDVDASPAALTLQTKLVVTAKAPGYSGNAITIALTTGATAGAEVVTVVGNAISVQIESGVSTATQIKTKVDESVAAMALIEELEILPGQDAATLTSAVAANLTGGDGLTLGAYPGVVAVSADDGAWLADFAIPTKRVGFFGSSINKAGNMFFAFGSLLKDTSNWFNQQYIEMPFDDGIDELGEALSLFDDRVSFALTDAEYGKRLAFFVAGGKAIIAPYVKKQLEVALQSRAIQWIAANQPQYTLKNAALLENRLTQDVIEDFIARDWISSGSVSITLQEQNFVGTGDIVVPDATALWRVVSRMRTE